MRKYIFAGLDFIFDREGNPWFLEANGSPHGMRNFDRLYPEAKLPELVSSFMQKEGKEFAVIANIEDKFDEGVENGQWVHHRLKRLISGLRLCYVHQNSQREGTLIDSDGETFVPDCIFRYGHKISDSFEKKIRMINPMVMRYIAMDKLLTTEILKRRLPGLMTPRTFLVKSTSELRKRLTDDPETFKDGYVIKPNYESLGFGVQVFSSPDEECVISKPMILQQRITPNLMDGEYWDLRVFLFDGKVVGGEIRRSVHNVTNVAFGSTPDRVPPGILDKVRKQAEEIVRAIDEEAAEISRSDDRLRELKGRTPKTVKNK